LYDSARLLLREQLDHVSLRAPATCPLRGITPGSVPIWVLLLSLSRAARPNAFICECVRQAFRRGVLALGSRLHATRRSHSRGPSSTPEAGHGRASRSDLLGLEEPALATGPCFTRLRVWLRSALLLSTQIVANICCRPISLLIRFCKGGNSANKGSAGLCKCSQVLNWTPGWQGQCAWVDHLWDTNGQMPSRNAHPLDGEMLQGTLDLLILQTLVLGPAHGHTIAHLIEQRSEEVLQIEHGSLYPALHRLEDRGWMSSFWGTSENNRKARYYRLTAAGRRQLLEHTSRWDRLVRAVNRVLRPAEE
jgi:PadR family transcriptional regulator, regulatory protein PadR